MKKEQKKLGLSALFAIKSFVLLDVMIHMKGAPVNNINNGRLRMDKQIKRKKLFLIK